MASIRWSHWTWEECRVFWEAKGYKLDSIAGEFEKKFGENSGFSRTTLAERSKSTEEAPPEVIELVWSLALVPGASKRRFEIVKRGLEEGAPLADLEALLADTGGKLDAFGAKLDSVLSAVGGKVDAILSSVGKLDAALSAVGKLASVLSAVGANVDAILSAVSKLAAAVSALGGKLDAALSALRTIEATVNHTDAKQDVEHAGLERATRKVLRAIYGSTGLLGLGLGVCVVGLLFVAVSRPAHAPEAAPQPVIIVTNMGPGGAPLGFDMRTLLGAVAGQVGEKVVDQYVPDRPLPNQKLPPCDGSLREEAMSGGCWTEIKGAPPCGRLFRRGGGCYRPIAADPSKPVGEGPRPGQGEPNGEQPRPMQEMPGREEN